MTPAEFKTLRESLGLSAQWLADRAGVALRTVQYWEAGRRARIPADVCAILTEIDDKFERAVALALEIYIKSGAPPKVTLLRYSSDADLWRYRPDMAGLPAAAHAALLARTRRALTAHGARVSIVYMDSPAARAWLAGRPDSPGHRAALAALQSGPLNAH